MDKDDLIELFPVYNTFPSISPSAANLAKEDEVSKPRAAVALRRWAIETDAVRRIDLYCSGTTYCAAVLLQDPPSIELMQELYAEVRALLKETLGKSVEAAVVGPDFETAPMFSRANSETIIDKGTTREHTS